MTTMPSPVTKEPARPNGSAPSSIKPADAETSPPTVLPDLAALADEALAALVEHGQAEMLRRKQKRETDFLQLVAETARTLGLAPARVAAAVSNQGQRQRPTGDRDRRHDVRPVYRDPVSGATWSGRGQAPPFVEFGEEISPKTGKKLPLRKFWIAEQEK
jgi:DNA-binding protein H-NS